MLDLRIIKKHFSLMLWLYNVIDITKPSDFNQCLIDICCKQAKGIIPLEEYKELGKISGYESVDYGYYIANIKYDLDYFIEGHFEIMKNVLLFLQNSDDEIFEINNRFILKELVFKLVDLYINHFDVSIKKTNSLELIIKRLISFSNKNINSQTVYFWDVDICVLNELNRIINHKIFDKEFHYENGEITLLCGAYDSYELQFLVKNYFNKKFGVVYTDDMYEYARRNFISSLTGLENFEIKRYMFDSADLEAIKDSLKYIEKNIGILDSNWDYKSDFLYDMYVEEYDFVLVYRIKKKMKNKNLYIKKLKEYAINQNKPVVIIYHCKKALHDISLDCIKEINQDNIDYVYGFLDGNNGYIKLE